MIYISSKLELFDFSGGKKPPIMGLTIIKRSWNYGNLPYLVANTYGLHFIKIGGIWIFWGGGGGQKPSISGVTCDLWCPFSKSDELFQSKVMCENLVSIGWNRRYVYFQGGGRGQKPPIKGGYMWPVMPIFKIGWAISVRSHVWKFGSDWWSLSRAIVSTKKKNKKQNKHTNKRKSSFFSIFQL